MAKRKSTAASRSIAWIKQLGTKIRGRRRSNVQLHRSFRRTKRRDYIRPLQLPGHFAFSAEVIKVLLNKRSLFIKLILLHALLIVIFGGISSQDIYGQLSQALGDESISLAGMIGQAGVAALLEFSAVGSGVNEAQQIYLALFVVLIWLSTVWLLREVLAGRRPKVRDGLYNSGSPIVATLLLVLVLLLQLLPLGVLAVSYGGLLQVGLAGEGLGAMLFFMVAALIATLCLYWITATLVAMVIVTLPGTYPLRALKTASEIVAGRRLKIAFRLIWLVALLAVVGLVVMIPAILLNQWLQSLVDWFVIVPLVPVVSSLAISIMTVMAASYVYLLYRKVVAYDAETGR